MMKSTVKESNEICCFGRDTVLLVLGICKKFLAKRFSKEIECEI